MPKRQGGTMLNVSRSMRDSQPKGWDFKFVGCVAFKDSHAHLANAYERLNRATTILVEAMYAHYDKMPID